MSSTLPRRLARKSLRHDGLEFSYLIGGEGEQTILALHDHAGSAVDWEPALLLLQDRFRVIALDLRGHGETGRGGQHDIIRYLGDLSALLEATETERAVLIGAGWGGVIAPLFAAAQTDRVTSLVVAGAGPEFAGNSEALATASGTFPTRRELEDALGERTASLDEQIRHVTAGWTLAFSVSELLESEKVLQGDHRASWHATWCPLLIIRQEGDELEESAEEMQTRRPNTTIAVLPAPLNGETRIDLRSRAESLANLIADHVAI